MLTREQFANKLFQSEKRYLLETRQDFDTLSQSEQDTYLAEADYFLTKPEAEWPFIAAVTNTANRKNGPKLSEEDRGLCRRAFASKEKSITELAKMYGVAYASMHTMLTRTEAQREQKRSNDRIRSRAGGKTCLDCPAQIIKNASRCNSCAQSARKQRSVKFPDLSTLKKMVVEHGLRGTGRLLHCSPVAITKKIARDEEAEKAA